MKKRTLIIDTCMICTWLGVPHMEVTGPRADRWDKLRIDALINEKKTEGYIFVLPVAAVIEAGNHIAHANDAACAQKLMGLLQATSIGNNPWAMFSEQNVLWASPNIDKLIAEWPVSIGSGVSIGDYTIEMIAEHYIKSGFLVELLTSDQGLQERALASSRLPMPRRSRYK